MPPDKLVMLCKRLSDEIIVGMNKKGNNVKSISGFGMIQVMVGVVVIGIMSMVFIRKSLNRQDLGIALQLISYRDQVLDYYTALASNRISWQNTRASNSSDWGTDSDIILVDLKDADGSTRIPKPGLKLSYDDNVVKGTILPNPLSTCKPADPDGEYKEANHFCLTATKLVVSDYKHYKLLPCFQSSILLQLSLCKPYRQSLPRN